MKHIIHEIREQPHHVRELATLLCTIAVVAVVVLVWFGSFQHDIYALLNPDQQPQQGQDQLFAQQSKSLFSSIIQAFNNGKAQISDLFSGNQAGVINSPSPSPTPTESTHPLPVAPSK